VRHTKYRDIILNNACKKTPNKSNKDGNCGFGVFIYTFFKREECTMKHNQKRIQLTAPELSDIWTAYQADTLDICAVNFFLQHVEHPDIRSLLELSLRTSEKRKKREIEFFNGENHPVPMGFTDEDVHLNAPRLFSDKIHLEYVLQISNLNLLAYGTALGLASRTDVIDFFIENLRDTQAMHKQAKELAKELGIFVRAPIIPTPDRVDFVKKDSFLSGWIGDKRPLLGAEIANLIASAGRNSVGQAVITAFSQVAENSDVRKYFEKGRDIASKHYEIFSNILRESYLSDEMLLTPEVTASTVSPFSDRLMLNFVTTLIASGIGQYGMALSSSPRHDLAAQYTRLMADIGKYANEGANLLIDHGWMEQPPMAADRKDLTKR
jgi:hypothetical protein